MPPRHPGPGFDPAHGPPPHFHPGGPRPPGADYGRPTPYPGPGMPRRHSHDVDASRAPNHHDEWVSEDEVDELDDDE